MQDNGRSSDGPMRAIIGYFVNEEGTPGWNLGMDAKNPPSMFHVHVAVTILYDQVLAGGLDFIVERASEDISPMKGADGVIEILFPSAWAMPEFRFSSGVTQGAALYAARFAYILADVNVNMSVMQSQARSMAEAQQKRIAIPGFIPPKGALPPGGRIQ